ncbi:hypothetical protein KU6B_44670 [Mameliella alba]|nr:hypothetical protein KU6B_44670 [Mameliella alba]
MQIHRAGSRPSVTPNPDYFTGTVRFDPVIAAPDPARVHALIVTFEPGARTAWHTHPLGQTLHILSGLCLAQKEGDPVQELRPGDTVWFAPGEKHWHGAAPMSPCPISPSRRPRTAAPPTGWKRSRTPITAAPAPPDDHPWLLLGQNTPGGVDRRETGAAPPLPSSQKVRHP